VLRYHSDIALSVQQPKTELEKKGEGEKKNVMNGTYVVDQVRDAQTGEKTDVQRMCGTGIFNDPNDFALILVTAIPMCLYWLTDSKMKLWRPFWLALLLFFGYALMLTHSRGGFLALVAGLGTLVHLKFGAKKSIMLGALFLPVLLVAFAGRMTSISASEGTGQTRLQLWADGLYIFRQSPLTGIGMDNYRQFSSHVAHHSFIHCYTELGLIGGSLFLGAFYFAVKGMYDVRAVPRPDDEPDEIDPELRRLHPFLSASLVAYTIGICFLSRSYIVPTYMILGLAVVYMRLYAKQATVPLPAWTVFTWPKLAGISCGFLVASNVFVRMFVK